VKRFSGDVVIHRKSAITPKLSMMKNVENRTEMSCIPHENEHISWNKEKERQPYNNTKHIVYVQQSNWEYEYTPENK
jgi:hypothetical protein